MRNEARNQAIRQLRKSGWKVESIGRKFGVHHSTVTYICSPERRKKCKDRWAAKRKTELVDVAEVRAHIVRLMGLGIGPMAICEAAQCAPATLYKIRKRTQTRVTREVIDRIMGVDESARLLVGDAALVDSGPTWEILRRMLRGGWSEADLAPMLGYSGRRVYIGLTNVSAAKAMRVKKLYDAIRAGKVIRGGTREAKA